MYYLIKDGAIKGYADTKKKLLGYFYFVIDRNGSVSFNGYIDSITYSMITDADKGSPIYRAGENGKTVKTSSKYTKEEAEKDFIKNRFLTLLKRDGYIIAKTID